MKDSTHTRIPGRLHVQHLLRLLCIGWALFCVTACQTPAPVVKELEQSQPRKLAKSLNLPDGYQPGFVIAGLDQGAVPQGLALISSDLALTSHYFDSGVPSCVVATDLNTGKALSTLTILEPDGSPHRGHVGGIASDTDSLWIASDAFLYRGSLSSLNTQTNYTVLRTLEKIKTEAANEVAFCAVFDGFVWAGEFALGDKYPTPESHHMVARDGSARTGWVSAYNPDNGFGQPERVLSIPDRAQGILATDEYILLSRSYGRRNRSTLDIFNNPLSEPPHETVQSLNGSSVPLWFLDGQNLVQSIDLPPMAENIAIHDGSLLILFESGAEKFRWFGKKPIDVLIQIPLTSALYF